MRWRARTIVQLHGALRAGRPQLKRDPLGRQTSTTAEDTVDPSSFLLGALLASAKALGIGAVGFGIAWWRARKRIRQLEAERQLDPQPILDRMDRLEGTLDSVAAAVERLAAGQVELQGRLPPARASSNAMRLPNSADS